MSCYTYTISGLVQGIGFRWETNQKAKELGLSGTVQNTSDGQVKVVVCGDIWQLEQFDAWLFSGGPTYSKIRNIEKDECTPEELPIDFKII